MIELAGKPTVGPYILTRELPPAAAFWTTPRTPELDPDLPPVVPPVSLPRAALSRSPDRLPADSFILDSTARSQPPGPSAAIVDLPREPPARFAALHQSNQSSHVLYRFPLVRGQRRRDLVRAAVDAVAALNHPHLLRIEHLLWDPIGHPWIVTPFSGDVDGVRPLSRLVREKHGQLSPNETEHAIEQLLAALAHAHAVGDPLPDLASTPVSPPKHHGPLCWDHILVDRRGALIVELFGLARLLDDAPRSHAELAREEVRSVVEIAYRLITGLRAEEPRIPAARLVPNLDPRWNAWFERGLDPSRGFSSATDALAALPSKVAHSPHATSQTPTPPPRPPRPGDSGGWNLWNWLTPR